MVMPTAKAQQARSHLASLPQETILDIFQMTATNDLRGAATVVRTCSWARKIFQHHLYKVLWLTSLRRARLLARTLSSDPSLAATSRAIVIDWVPRGSWKFKEEEQIYVDIVMTVARTHGQIVHLHANCYAGTGRAPVPNNVAYDHLFSLLVYTNIAGLYEMRNVQLPSVTDLLIVGQLAPWIVSDLRDQYPSLRRLAVVVGRDTSHLVLNALSAFWKRDEDGHFTGAQLDVVTIFIGASIRKSFELKLVKLRNASGTHTQVVCISFPDSSLVLRWDARAGRTLAAAMSRAHLAGYIWDVPQLDEGRFQLSTLYETREDPWSTMHL